MKKDKEYKTKITDRRVWASIERTVQIKPYQPEKVVFGMSGDIPDGSNPVLYYDEMFDTLDDQVNKVLTELIEG